MVSACGRVDDNSIDPGTGRRGGLPGQVSRKTRASQGRREAPSVVV